MRELWGLIGLVLCLVFWVFVRLCSYGVGVIFVLVCSFCWSFGLCGILILCKRPILKKYSSRFSRVDVFLMMGSWR